MYICVLVFDPRIIFQFTVHPDVHCARRIFRYGFSGPLKRTDVKFDEEDLLRSHSTDADERRTPRYSLPTRTAISRQLHSPSFLLAEGRKDRPANLIRCRLTSC